jgi:PAS domain S-box-containing protein
VDELIGRSCHEIWHHTKADHSPYPEQECPIYAGYRLGLAHQGEDQAFWRKDGTKFPVRYMSSPTYENGDLTGAVVVFRDITERKQAEAEIAQRSVRLAAQNAVAATLSRSLELDTILSTALDMVLSVLEMDVGLIFLSDPETGALVMQSYHGQVPPDEMEEAVQDRACCLGISTEAVTGMQAVTRTVSDYPTGELPSYIVKESLQTLVSTPLLSKGRAVGALTLGSRQADAVRQSELELLTAIGQQIGMAIENARLYRAAERSAEELTLLHQVSIFLTSTLDPAEIYEQIAEQSAILLGCQMACILAWDKEHQRAKMVSGYGLTESQGEILRAQSDASGLLPDLTRQHQSVAIDEVRTDSRVPIAWQERLHIQALLCVPMWGTEEPLGTLFLMDRRASRRWRSGELELIESFVNRAAVALVNANLHEQLEWAAALEERQRIAADMHDGLAQTVSILGLQVDQTTQLIAAGSSSEAVEELHHIRDIVGRVSVDVRRSIASLHEPPQPRHSLQELLSDLPHQFSPDDGPPVALTNRVTEPLYLMPEQRAQALPVVQEAILNARRHAQAQRIDLLLERRGPEVSITVRDDGQGFDPSGGPSNRQGHFGLSIMRARAARIGGSLQIDSAPGRGTRVNLTWSLDGDRQTTAADGFRQEAALQTSGVRGTGS